MDAVGMVAPPHRDDVAVVIRAARAADLSVLQDIERAAGRSFADIGMTLVANEDPPTLDTLISYQIDGRAWVATDSNDHPTAYLLVDLVDEAAHIEQVTVHPDHSRRGVGRSLIEHAATWATQRGLTALTLTTFTNVPWNGPYYARCGFRTLSDVEITPGLRVLRAREAALGLDAWPRSCMRREL